MRYGGVILCGGQSRRMGYPKALLPFGPELMLQRVARVLGEVVSPIVVVAARGQEVPDLRDDVIVVRDRRENRGPLEGLCAGLAALAGQADAAFATSCDAPRLRTPFVRRMLQFVEGHDIAVPRSGGYEHPLAAVYRTSLITSIERLLAADRMRPVFLFEDADTRFVDEVELRQVDPGLVSLQNLNDPQAYLAALEDEGYTPTPEVLAAMKQ